MGERTGHQFQRKNPWRNNVRPSVITVRCHYGSAVFNSRILPAGNCRILKSLDLDTVSYFMLIPDRQKEMTKNGRKKT